MKNGLLKNVKSVVPAEYHDKIDSVSLKSSIYVLYAVDVIAVTHESLVHEFASYKSRYPQRDWDSFMKYKSNWDRDKYKFIAENIAYFSDLETAVDKTVSNRLDFNEGGAYPYAIICEMPLNAIYAFSYNRKMWLYKYNRNTGEYEKISWEDSQDTLYLKKYCESGGLK